MIRFTTRHVRWSGEREVRAQIPRIAFLAAVCRSAGHYAEFGRSIWDEALFGDLSDDRFNPTHVTLTQGTSSPQCDDHGGDIEYLNVTVPSGLVFSGLIHVSWAGLDQLGFMAIQSGSIFTEPPEGTEVANLLGYNILAPAKARWGRTCFPAGERVRGDRFYAAPGNG